MSATTVTFRYDASENEAEFYTATGETLFTMAVSFRDANTINDAIRMMEKKAFDRGVAEACQRIRDKMRGLEEVISLDAEEDEEEAPKRKRRGKEQIHRA